MRWLVLLSALAAALLVAPSATAQQTSLSDVEDEVMCTTCKLPLNVVPESPQAEKERDLIRRLIARGHNKDQIKAALVTQFGKNVLALPQAKGFGITAYAIPLTLLGMLAAGLLVLLPRWRRRSSAAIATNHAPALSRPESIRLDDELARYER